MRLRRLRQGLAVVLLAVLVALPTASSAATHETHGWWWRAQTGLLGAELPPPPDVPEDGLLVERTPDGATAVSAVRYQLDESESDPVLVLTVASGSSEGAAIAACPTSRTGWTGEQGGRWDSAPGWDCNAGRVDGVVSEDGATWSWELAPLVRDGGVISVMLVDGTTNPFHVAFEAPTDASMETTTAPPPPPDAPDPVAPPPPGQDTTQPPPPSGGSGEPVFVPPAVEAPSAPAPGGTSTEAPAAPEVAAPQQPADTSGPVPIAQPQPAATEVSSGLSPVAFALMLAIIALLGADVLRDRAVIAQVLRGGRTTDGGIGRFARERTAPPDPLW